MQYCKITKIMTAITMIPATFTIDGEFFFKGFHDGTTSNGWACPYFSKKQGAVVCQEFELDQEEWMVYKTIDGVEYYWSVDIDGWTWDVKK